MEIDIKKKLAKNWFKVLQDTICFDIEEIEKNRNEMSNANLQSFPLMAPPHTHLTSPFLLSFHPSNS